MKKTLYAKGTTVPAMQSQQEIQKLITAFGADQFGFATAAAEAMVTFRCNGRFIRFSMPLPRREEFRGRSRGYRYGFSSAQDQADKELRRRWRALALVIKAKFEASQSGITTFEAEFMAHTVMPDGKTVAEHALPMIARAYETGVVPKGMLLLGAGDPPKEHGKERS